MKRFVPLTVLATLALAASVAHATPAVETDLSALACQALRAGQHEAAADLAREAIRIAPDRPAPYLVLGLALDALDRYDDAAAAYRVVVKLGSMTSRSVLLLARALARAGDIDGATRAYALARSLATPDRTAALDND